MGKRSRTGTRSRSTSPVADSSRDADPLLTTAQEKKKVRTEAAEAVSAPQPTRPSFFDGSDSGESSDDDLQRSGKQATEPPRVGISILNLSDGDSDDGELPNQEDPDERTPEEIAAMKRQLLTHVKVTAEELLPASAPTTDATASLRQHGATTRTPAEAAWLEMKKELTRPVSTALTVVDAADEAEETLAAVIDSKIPPPTAAEKERVRKLKRVDHSLIRYIDIQKALYVEPPDMKTLSPEELVKFTRELDGAVIRGKEPPKPLRRWEAAGLPESLFPVLEAHNFAAPFAVQSVGIPALMSGRDLLLTAKTGSGKTLCYALPLVRHCLAQPRCQDGSGPVGLVLVPTQELAVQVFTLLAELCDACDLRAVPCYGATSLQENIRAIRRGFEVAVCTPGRLLDLLTINNGSTMSLQRVSFVVVDEADRLFDSGFMGHLDAFLRNIRPDRQVAMISATMPKQLKKVVMTKLANPVEVSVGGKVSPSSNVDQGFYFFDRETYEVDKDKRKEEDRFVKLCEILGVEAVDGTHLVLIFVERPEEVNTLYGNLSRVGYHNHIATLYGGMDPTDRTHTLERFRKGDQFILIATGVAERGLDIPFLDLVINYTLPDHYEAYVHRVGRTGRAGQRGKAASFFVRGKDDDIAPELVAGLEQADLQAPVELIERANAMREKRKNGQASHNRGFYRGYLKGKEMRLTGRDQKEAAVEAAKSAGLDGYLSSSSSADDSDRDSDSEDDIVPVTVYNRDEKDGGTTTSADGAGLYSTSLVVRSASGNSGGALALRGGVDDRIARALAYAQKTTAAVQPEGAEGVRFQTEYLINDLPNLVRGHLQKRAFLESVAQETETTIVKKGIYYDRRLKSSHMLKEGEKPLYLLIIGKTQDAVRAARQKLNEKRDDVESRQKAQASAIGATFE